MITNSFIKRMIAYLEAKENRTEEENGLLAILKDNEDAFVVTTLTRQDLKDRGYDASNVSDDTMDYIAWKMGDAFCEDGIFWNVLEAWADHFNIPVKEEAEDED